MPYLSVSQAKHNALKKENERLKEELEAEKVHSSLIFDEKNDLEAKLKELLSEDLVAENAKLKLKIWEMECTIPKIKADAIREACRSNTAGSDSVGVFCYQAGLLIYADEIEAGK